jgi:hypothetical protein
MSLLDDVLWCIPLVQPLVRVLGRDLSSGPDHFMSCGVQQDKGLSYAFGHRGFRMGRGGMSGESFNLAFVIQIQDI